MNPVYNRAFVDKVNCYLRITHHGCKMLFDGLNLVSEYPQTILLVKSGILKTTTPEINQEINECLILATRRIYPFISQEKVPQRNYLLLKVEIEAFTEKTV